MHRSQHTEDQAQPDQNQILEALNAVLESDKFTSAPQMSAFLRYVVEQAASGNMTRIKAYTVAIDALGKPDSFDPQNDPVVRVLAGRLRAALASYYEANPNVELRITMRPGTYVPSFVNRTKAEAFDKSTVAQKNQTPSKTTTQNTYTIRSSTIPDSSRIDNSLNRSIDSNEQSSLIAPTESTNVVTDQNSTSDNTKESHNQDIATHFRWMFRLPFVGIALAALGIFVGSQLSQYKAAPDSENTNASAKVALNTPVQRKRPQQVSLFVKALDQGNSLNDQVNTMLSGIFSESDSLHVYRVFNSSQLRQHWPEDYLVSVGILPLPSETRVSIQLVEALTGRVSHSENITLSKNAPEGLTGDELVLITEFARNLISEDGPLFDDYNTKLASAN